MRVGWSLNHKLYIFFENHTFHFVSLSLQTHSFLCQSITGTALLFVNSNVVFNILLQNNHVSYVIEMEAVRTSTGQCLPRQPYPELRSALHSLLNTAQTVLNPEEYEDLVKVGHIQNHMRPGSGRKEPMSCILEEWILDESRRQIKFLPSRLGFILITYIYCIVTFLGFTAKTLLFWRLGQPKMANDNVLF